MDYQFHWRPVIQALPDLLKASLVTLEVSLIAMALGLMFGLVLYFCRASSLRLLRGFGSTWVEIARNTPSLFQIFVFYWGLGEFGIFLSSFTAVVAALTFNCAGYMAETYRGGFNAVPAGQDKAARTLGMTKLQSLRYVVLPQVLRAIYGPMTNQFTWVILASSLGMLAGLRELSGETQYFNSRTFRTFEFFAATAVIYYLIAKIALILMRLLGRPLFRAERARP
ncbi:Inner membrane amino-acid ABC transporter permease protein YecS [Aquimixticola soesokkakensis]|uniref:Inner membrane amino-acid ABC transporter permease protein YecS n=1 Tax=Aquimixticola soesokkakensis TaxID=1519096 RepID=A0A1Y5T7W6_9RHOB|nr:amino acid ABC transporter permease [Aquimixticola soesokkakensis]SLN55951.1 Inner membrane amino-acid ABC transporter permease protein YecS [Aquimixticola soesokkakensis]